MEFHLVILYMPLPFYDPYQGILLSLPLIKFQLRYVYILNASRAHFYLQCCRLLVGTKLNLQMNCPEVTTTILRFVYNFCFRNVFFAEICNHLMR